MVIESVEHSRSELIEPRRLFPVRVATGQSDLTGSEVNFEIGNTVTFAGETDDSFEMVDSQFGGHLSRQIDLYRFDLARNPDSPHALNNLGRALLNQDHPNEALVYLERAIAISSKLVEVHANIVRALTALGRIADAREAAEALIREEPNSPLALSVLAHVYACGGSPTKAIDTYSKILERSRDDFASLYNRGVQFLLRGNRHKAIGDLRRASSIRPRLASPHNALGVCYALEGSLKKAIRYFRASSAMAPIAEATRNLSMALVIANEPEEALVVLEKHVTRFPGDVETRERLASTLRELGQRGRSVTELLPLLREAEEAQTETLPRLYNNVGVVMTEQREFEKGARYLELSFRLRPNEIVFENLARVLIADRQLARATAVYETCRDIYRTAFTDAFGARLAELAGRYDQAMLLYHSAIDIGSDEPHGYAGLSKLLVDIDLDPEASIALLEAAMPRCPRNLALLNNLAYSYLMADRAASARRILDEVQDVSGPYSLVATRGLLKLHEGDLKEGSRLYNEAARLAADDHARALVEQKKWIEVCRYWLKRANFPRAKRALASARKSDAEEDLFVHQMDALDAIISP